MTARIRPCLIYAEHLVFYDSVLASQIEIHRISLLILHTSDMTD